MNRDSMGWWLALGAAAVGYLITAQHPPWEWSYMEWLQACSVGLAWLAGKLSSSPLPGAPPADRIDPARLGKGVVLLAAAGLTLASCATAPPPDLTPPAQVAYQSTRIVRALDVARDTAVALQPGGTVTVRDTREIVLWHRTAVVAAEASPAGWRLTVRAGIYMLTCDPRAAVTTPPPSCTPRLPAETIQAMSPYIGIGLILLSEIGERGTPSEEVIAQFKALCQASIGIDDGWLKAHPGPAK